MTKQQNAIAAKMVKNVKDKLKETLIGKQRFFNDVEEFIAPHNTFTLNEQSRLQIPQIASRIDAIWKFQLVDIKRQQWKIRIKLTAIRQLGYQLKINPPFYKNQVQKILSNFNSNNQKKNQRCKAQLQSDRTLSLQYISPCHEYNKNKKIEKIIQTMNKLQRYFETVFKQIISYTSISYSFSRKTQSQLVQRQELQTNNQSSQLLHAMSVVSCQSIPKSTAQTYKLKNLPTTYTNNASEKSGIVRFFSNNEIIGKESYVDGYSEDSQSLSILLFGKYRLYIEASLYPQSSFATLLKNKPVELKLIKKKIHKKIQKLSICAFTSQTSILKALRNDASCQYIARYYMKTITKNQQQICDFFFVEIYEETLQNLVRQNKVTLKEYMKIFADIVKGIKYLNKDRRILHRDIKASNICILRENERYIPKIIDFGSGIQLGDSQNYNGRTPNNYFTQGYHIPYEKCTQEVKRKYTTQQAYNKNRAFDIYSFGAMLQWFCISYMKRNVQQQFQAWSGCVKIIKSCKQADPDKRPSIQQLITKFTYLSI